LSPAHSGQLLVLFYPRVAGSIPAAGTIIAPTICAFHRIGFRTKPRPRMKKMRRKIGFCLCAAVPLLVSLYLLVSVFADDQTSAPVRGTFYQVVSPLLLRGRLARLSKTDHQPCAGMQRSPGPASHDRGQNRSTTVTGGQGDPRPQLYPDLTWRGDHGDDKPYLHFAFRRQKGSTVIDSRWEEGTTRLSSPAQETEGGTPVRSSRFQWSRRICTGPIMHG